MKNVHYLSLYEEDRCGCLFRDYRIYKYTLSL